MLLLPAMGEYPYCWSSCMSLIIRRYCLLWWLLYCLLALTLTRVPLQTAHGPPSLHDGGLAGSSRGHTPKAASSHLAAASPRVPAGAGAGPAASPRAYGSGPGSEAGRHASCSNPGTPCALTPALTTASSCTTSSSILLPGPLPLTTRPGPPSLHLAAAVHPTSLQGQLHSPAQPSTLQGQLHSPAQRTAQPHSPPPPAAPLPHSPPQPAGLQQQQQPSPTHSHAHPPPPQPSARQQQPQPLPQEGSSASDVDVHLHVPTTTGGGPLLPLPLLRVVGRGSHFATVSIGETVTAATATSHLGDKVVLDDGLGEQPSPTFGRVLLQPETPPGATTAGQQQQLSAGDATACWQQQESEGDATACRRQQQEAEACVRLAEGGGRVEAPVAKHKPCQLERICSSGSSVLPRACEITSCSSEITPWEDPSPSPPPSQAAPPTPAHTACSTRSTPRALAQGAGGAWSVTPAQLREAINACRIHRWGGGG